MSSARETVGWIGTGIMGAAMCARLLARRIPLVVHTRTKKKADGLLRQGATWKDSPKAVAEGASIVFTMVGFPQDVHTVYFGDEGVLHGVQSGSVLIDMTSTEPPLAVSIAEAALKRGAAALDAPVSGGDVGARDGTLSIMVGGDQHALDRARPLLVMLGKKIMHHGGPGSGQHAKLCNQIVIASTMIGVCEALLYGHKAGLDLPTLLESIAGGAAGCWTLEKLAPRILARNFTPGFLVDHFLKDMGIALIEASRMGLALPGLALAHQLYLSVHAHGHGQAGTHALMLALESLSATRATREGPMAAT